eukprot:6201311-Pleurochrysis_carterae.AAC.1
MAAGGAAEETAMTAQAQAEAAQAQAERAQTQAELALSQAEAAKLQAEAAQAQLGHRQLTTALAGRALPEPFGRESVIAAIEEIKAGRPIVVTDDESRENEGDLIMAAQAKSIPPSRVLTLADLLDTALRPVGWPPARRSRCSSV